MKELLELVEARHHAPGETVAIATVVRIEGSSYRRMGARMLINRHGRVAGSVSGGCLEQSVIEASQDALHDGQSRLLNFDTTDPRDVLFGSGLGCRGKIWIALEVLQPRQVWPLAEFVQQVRRDRQPVLLLTRIRQLDAMVSLETTAYPAIPLAGAETSLPAAWCETMREVFANGRNCFLGGEGSDMALAEWLAPPVALWIFGAGPDVPPLTKLARELGYETTVIDRRPELARPENFPAANRVLATQRAQLPPQLHADPFTVAVLMNHHYETDRAMLAALLPLGLSYLGLLGPRRRTDALLSELQGQVIELTETSTAALHAPAGLDIGAENPTAIALSILAEIQATLSGHDGGPLKFRNAPIHAKMDANFPCAVPA